MWKLIDHVLRPNDLVYDKSIFTHDQVFPIYSKLCEINVMLNDFAQIDILKKELDGIKSTTS